MYPPTAPSVDYTLNLATEACSLDSKLFSWRCWLHELHCSIPCHVAVEPRNREPFDGVAREIALIHEEDILLSTSTTIPDHAFSIDSSRLTKSPIARELKSGAEWLPSRARGDAGNNGDWSDVAQSSLRVQPFKATNRLGKDAVKLWRNIQRRQFTRSHSCSASR